MKKKHFKLLTTMASLLLVVSVMAVGIWAATQQSFKLTSSISFQATGIQASIYAKVGGDVVKSDFDTEAEGDDQLATATIGSVKMKADTYAEIQAFTAEDEASEPTKTLTYAFDDKGDGFIAPTGTEFEEVTLSLVIANTDANIDLYYHILPIIDLVKDADSVIQIKSATIQTGTFNTTDLTFTAGADAATAITAKNNTANTVALAGHNGTTTACNAVEVVITLSTNASLSAVPTDEGFTVDIELKNTAIDMPDDEELTWNQTPASQEGED